MNFNNPYAINNDNIKINARFDIQNENGVTRIAMTPLETCRIKEVIFYSGTHEFPSYAKFYGEGYQKLSQYAGTISNIKSFTGYSDNRHYKMPQKNGYKTVYNYALINIGKNTTLIGATGCNRFRLEIRINGRFIEIAQCLEDVEFKCGEKIILENMIVLNGEKNNILDVFSKKISENHPRKIYGEIPSGWCSWYCIGPDISEKAIFDNLKIIKDKAPRLKYIQIDDGFQPFMGDWLETGNKFDRSMKEICNDIKKQGFEPAIWLAPFIASPKSKLFAEHPDYFIKDTNGMPLCSKNVTFGGWRDGPWYFVDGTNPDAQNFIYDTVKEIRENWGVKYFKLDANVWGALPFGVRYDKGATSIDAYRMGMDAVWRAAGEDALILGCNAPMWPSLGCVTAMRVTNDVIRNVIHASNLAKQCFNRNWMHNKLWINDPDCLIMANTKASVMDPGGITKKSMIKRSFYKFNNIYVRASGGTVLSGDYVGNYAKTDIERLNRLLDMDHTAAVFDDDMEIGVIKNHDAPEYFIFNRRAIIKRYHIKLPKNSLAFDMYDNKEIKIHNNSLVVYLKKYGAAWIKVKYESS